MERKQEQASRLHKLLQSGRFGGYEHAPVAAASQAAAAAEAAGASKRVVRFIQQYGCVLEDDTDLQLSQCVVIDMEPVLKKFFWPRNTPRF